MIFNCKQCNQSSGSVIKIFSLLKTISVVLARDTLVDSHLRSDKIETIAAHQHESVQRPTEPTKFCKVYEKKI